MPFFGNLEVGLALAKDHEAEPFVTSDIVTVQTNINNNKGLCGLESGGGGGLEGKLTWAPSCS